MRVPADIEQIKEGARILREGGIVAFPTETVYGLGADAFNEAAIERIFEVKGRPGSNPLIVHVGDVESVAKVANISLVSQSCQRAFNLLSSLWPGPITFVLPALDSLPLITRGGKDSVAIRVPSHPVALSLIKESKLLIAAPSANRSSYISPTTAAHVEDDLGSKIDLILDSGETPIGIESTVVSLLGDAPKILRPGTITAEMISEIIGLPVSSLTQGGDLNRAPGHLPVHYAPRTRLFIRRDGEKPPTATRVGLVSFGPIPDLQGPWTKVRILSETANLNEGASKLYMTLRELDDGGLDLIVVDACDARGLGWAIMDRLERASS